MLFVYTDSSITRSKLILFYKASLISEDFPVRSEILLPLILLLIVVITYTSCHAASADEELLFQFEHLRTGFQWVCLCHTHIFHQCSAMPLDLVLLTRPCNLYAHHRRRRCFQQSNTFSTVIQLFPRTHIRQLVV